MNDLIIPSKSLNAIDIIKKFELKLVTKQEVLEAISDDKSQELFNLIACGKDADLLILSEMTRKEYYTRLSKLLKANLVKKVQKKYFLTTFGKVIFEMELRLSVAVNNRWKLNALDNLYATDTIPASARSRVMNEIILNVGNNKIISDFTKMLSKPDISK